MEDEKGEKDEKEADFEIFLMGVPAFVVPELILSAFASVLGMITLIFCAFSLGLFSSPGESASEISSSAVWGCPMITIGDVGELLSSSEEL